MHRSRDDDQGGERLPQSGDRIAGKYVVERVLKRGGMGVVLAARHAELSQPVAIKVLLPELSQDPAMVARFLREGRAVSALRSDHVVRVHDVGRLEGGTPYLVMEMLHGSDLDRRIRKFGPLPFAEAVGYVMQVCEALVEAHAIGIIHRDLKPSNLFLVDLPSGVSTVKVLDFGISKMGGLDAPLSDAHAITTTEAVLGSPTFMAPEQLKSAKYVDARADIWSLGLVLYFLLTGKLAFNAETLGAYLIKILQEPPVPPSEYRQDIPSELEAIILRCIEKDPEHRYATAFDLRSALAPFAPFAAHVSGMYAAAGVPNFGSPGFILPHSMGLPPSAPTPVGGVASAVSRGLLPSDPLLRSAMVPLGTNSGQSPGMQIRASLPNTLGPLAEAPTPAPNSSHRGPALGVADATSSPSGAFSPPSSSSPKAALGGLSEPPMFGSAHTQASWTGSGQRLRPSRSRYVAVFALMLAGGMLAAFLGARGSSSLSATSPAGNTTASPAVVAQPPTSSSAAPSAALASSAPPSAEPTSQGASALSGAPSASASAKPPTNSGAGASSGTPASPTGRPKATSTKRISGPMETDL